MSFVCHSKKPSCAGAGGDATKRYGAVVSRVVRRRTLRRGRVAGVGASGRGRSKADGRRSQDLDVLLRRDGVAAGDGREACGQSGVISARRAARGRAAARAQRSGHPWRRRAGESAGADAIWNWRPSQLPGGSRAAGTHQMQRQSCQRRSQNGFASWLRCAERNYKLLSWSGAFGVDLGFCARFRPLLVFYDPCTDATTPRSSKHRDTRSLGGLESWRHTELLKPPAQTLSECSVEHAASAREVLSDTADGPCKSSSSDAPFGCLAVPSCLHHPALASPLTARAIEEGTSDARPPADNCCNREL